MLAGTSVSRKWMDFVFDQQCRVHASHRTGPKNIGKTKAGRIVFDEWHEHVLPHRLLVHLNGAPGGLDHP